MKTVVLVWPRHHSNKLREVQIYEADEVTTHGDGSLRLRQNGECVRHIPRGQWGEAVQTRVEE